MRSKIVQELKKKKNIFRQKSWKSTFFSIEYSILNCRVVKNAKKKGYSGTASRSLAIQ